MIRSAEIKLVTTLPNCITHQLDRFLAPPLYRAAENVRSIERAQRRRPLEFDLVLPVTPETQQITIVNLPAEQVENMGRQLRIALEERDRGAVERIENQFISTAKG